MLTGPAVESRLASLLRNLARFHILLYLLGLVGAYLGASTDFFVEPPLTSNAVAGLGLLALLAWIAANDVRRYRLLIWILAAGCLTAALGALFFLLTPEAGAFAGALMLIAIVWGLFSFLLVALLLEAPAQAPVWQEWQPSTAPSGWERAARWIYLVVGAASALAGVVHFIMPFTMNPVGDIFHTPVMVLGSAVKVIGLGLLLILAGLDVRRRGLLATLFIAGNVLSLIVVIATHFGINRFGPVAYPALGLDSRAMMHGALLLDGVVIAGFIALKLTLDAAILSDLRFLSPIQFRALEAVAETLIDGDGEAENIDPAQIALRTDRYLDSFPSRRLWLARLALMGLEILPLMTLRPPMPYLNPQARREFVDLHFKRQIVERRGIYRLLYAIAGGFPVDVVEGMMRFNMQLTYLGYYSDPDVQAAVGYVPFSQRDRSAIAHPIRRHPPLRVSTPAELRQTGTETLSADVVIIGSGAAGAILAEQMAASGREVLVLEKGPYVPPDDFTEDEVGMISKLYSDGALQISQSLRFTVLQGSCVGGTTVVNNAVCFDTPDEVIELWRQTAGLEPEPYRAALAAVRERMGVRSIRESSGTVPWAEVVNPSDRLVGEGVAAYAERTGVTAEYDVVSANITDCLGCGYCNIGCRYGRKLSMLDEVLPKTQHDYPERFRLLAEAEVTKLRTQGDRVSEVVVRARDGSTITVRPNTVILSAGAIASPWLLMQSGVGAGQLPVGRYLCFNMGSPLHGLWKHEHPPINAYAGLQIGHYLRPLRADDMGYVYETWYNPPVAQALAMPGWLNTHFRNMRDYAYMGAVGVLVGTEATVENQLRSALFLRGMPDIVYKPTEKDLSTLVRALAVLGEVMFDAGADTIFASTRHYMSYHRSGNPRGMYQAASYQGNGRFAEDLEELVKDERDILLGTGHPQGGTRMHKDRGRNGSSGGVIDPDFRVYGYRNLYVCDASVFPTATTVNPQLTVMALARYAAERIQH